MASEQTSDEARRPPPLGLRGLSRVAFQPRSTPPPSFSIGSACRPPPLGLAGRAPLPSFSIGTASSEQVERPRARVVRRVGLSRPARRPPSPSQAGSSNWASSPGGDGSERGGNGRSTYVGFNIFNGGTGISFGGTSRASGIRIGEGSSVFGGTSSVGGVRIGEGSTVFGGTGRTTGVGGDNAENVGYRGKGYNPNFEHADEYPPSQEFLQAPPRKEIDLNVLANKQKRKQYPTDDKRHIYAMLLARNGEKARLKKGVLDSVVRDAKCTRRCVQRIWTDAKVAGTINGIKCKRKLHSGKKKIPLDIEALEAIPAGERTTIRQVAGHLNMSKTTVHQRLKEKQIRRITSELKPMLTEKNKKTRVAYSLGNLEPSSLENDPTFKGNFNMVHLDEKNFYRTRKNQNMYLSHREEAPRRECKHKNHIQQIMFLSAMARPRYDAQGNCIFDGKIGVWAFVDWVQAQKRSGNRERGTWEVKPSTSVNRDKSREYIVNYVLPAIKEKWPEKDRWNTVYIQQDNARTHVLPNDPIFVHEAARGGWDIQIVNQPPNSPDCNILDLGWFASIQAMFHRKMPKTLPEIIQKVRESLAEYPHQKLNRIWLSHQACMREIIKHKGSQHYALPHLKKKTLERQGILPVRLTVDKEYVEAAIEYLNGP